MKFHRNTRKENMISSVEDSTNFFKKKTTMKFVFCLFVLVIGCEWEAKAARDVKLFG